MKTLQKIDDEEIRLRIMEGIEDLDGILNELYQISRRAIASFLEKKFFLLSPEDLASAVNDSFITLASKIKSNGINLERPLTPLLITIANRRAIDILRKRGNNESPLQELNERDYMDAVTAHSWKQRERKGGVQEIYEQVQHYFIDASDLEKAVAESLLTLSPPKPKPGEMKEAVEKILGRPVPQSSVNSTLSRVRIEIRALLQ